MDGRGSQRVIETELRARIADNCLDAYLKYLLLMSAVIWQVSGSIEILNYLVLSGSDTHQQVEAIVYQINFKQITNQVIISCFKESH